MEKLIIECVCDNADKLIAVSAENPENIEIRLPRVAYVELNKEKAKDLRDWLNVYLGEK